MNVNNSADITVDQYEKVLKSIHFEDSSMNKFLSALILNTILENLSNKERLFFYDLIENGNYGTAGQLVLNKIPDFEDKLIIKSKTLMKNGE